MLASHSVERGNRFDGVGLVFVVSAGRAVGAYRRVVRGVPARCDDGVTEEAD
ncbi:hypothetical protein RRSWK_01972 [Rhodopirellula sp. SWK7]|nr:hypothetical protein RRSWK_01972 [Rhodopirellula sp. SWK7]